MTSGVGLYSDLESRVGREGKLGSSVHCRVGFMFCTIVSDEQTPVMVDWVGLRVRSDLSLQDSGGVL